MKPPDMSSWTAKSIPPLAPTANGGLTRGSDLPIHLPPAFCKNTVQICRGIFQGIGKLGRHHQSLKHRYTQSQTRAAHHSEGVSSLGIFRVFALFGIKSRSWTALGQGFGNLLDFASPWDSLLSCDHTVQYFWEIVKPFMQFPYF